MRKYKRRIYLIIVLIYNLDGSNKILIHINILLMTSVFYIGGSILRSFLTVIFYTCIFVKDEMHVDFFT